MNADALVLALLALADLVLLAYLRRRHARRLRMERMMASLNFAVLRANRVREMRVRPRFRQAS